ncbi:uncharacterized protein A1O5_09676 [Cladophialophora psammophila CBS 110553]|uniref:Uncharacterized protein n=1 Tax=Cladophialophora psammophila CBS 110553 TaxID=1182543 RepID=W9WPV7_9EURO|nr:uncharacterized protein A1O5_09676 [Cladophialophora psammophila CBS 110553]EXJ67030.1 hypothetical protein A1O5_09676 [Cladophialophora psammophila CBS 110553]
MTAHQSVIFKHWVRIINQWPLDRVRPAHVHFQKVMQSRLQKPRSPTSAAAAVKSNNAVATPVEPFNEQREMRQVNALYALLENRFSNEYPTPQLVRHPKSNTSHYDDLVRELDDAPGRSWFISVWNRLKGSIRLR